jgi:hypothetical protein
LSKKFGWYANEKYEETGSKGDENSLREGDCMSDVTEVCIAPNFTWFWLKIKT